MTDRQRRNIETQLRRERAEAARLLAATTARADVDRSTTDRADIATIEIERGMDLLVNTMESAAVEEIDEALALLESAPEEYGRCIVCGQEIAAARLELLPSTRYCAADSPTH